MKVRELIWRVASLSASVCLIYVTGASLGAIGFLGVQLGLSLAQVLLAVSDPGLTVRLMLLDTDASVAQAQSIIHTRTLIAILGLTSAGTVLVLGTSLTAPLLLSTVPYVASVLVRTSFIALARHESGIAWEIRATSLANIVESGIMIAALSAVNTAEHFLLLLGSLSLCATLILLRLVDHRTKWNLNSCLVPSIPSLREASWSSSLLAVNGNLLKAVPSVIAFSGIPAPAGAAAVAATRASDSLLQILTSTHTMRLTMAAKEGAKPSASIGLVVLPLFLFVGAAGSQLTQSVSLTTGIVLGALVGGLGAIVYTLNARAHMAFAQGRPASVKLAIGGIAATLVLPIAAIAVAGCTT